MAEFVQPLGYISDAHRRHEDGGIISLPDLSDINSSKKKKKVSKKHKIK
jgi:hypothetical protein